MQSSLSSKWLCLAAAGCCFIGIAYLELQDSSEVCAAQHREGDWVITGTEVVQNADVLLDGNLTVQGGGSLTLRHVRLTLNGTYDGQYGIHVQAGGSITIEAGSVITAASGAGHFSFVAEEGSQFVMQDSELHGCGWGTEVQDPAGPTEAAPISWDTAGLFIQADEALVERSTFSYNFGALVLAGTGITVQDNTVASNEYNPLTVWGSDNIIRDNDIHHVPRSGFSRCMDLHGNGHTVIGNTFSGELGIDAVCSGISLHYSWNNTIADNTFYDLTGGGIGLLMWDMVSSNNVITGNTISCGECGIGIGGRNNIVEANTIGPAEAGIEVMYSYDNVIADNTLTQIGSQNGIRLTHSSDNTIVNNHISEVDSDGILVWNSSKDNLFQGNVITSTKLRGLALFYDCNDNVVRDNVISGTGDSTILMESVAGNLVYRNNFLSEEPRPYDAGSNSWDEGGVGNFWGDYGGTDADGDGIGDQPYDIEPDGMDRCPLMQPVTPQPGLVTTPPVIPFQEKPAIINITGEETWEHQTLTLDAEIAIQEGGSLTLRDVTLTLGSETYPALIAVKPGGSLYIYESRMAETERGYGGRFVVEEGATLVMQDSDLRGIYYDWWNGGFEIFSDGAILTGNDMTGVILQLFEVSSATVVNNTIRDSLVPLWVNGGEHLTVTDNEFLGSILCGVSLGGYESHDNLIANNTFSGNWWAAVTLGGGATATVTGNCVENGAAGIILYSSDNEIVGNNLSDTNWAVGLVGCSGNQVLNNTITNGWLGIDLQSSSGNTVAGNRILSVAGPSLRVGDGSHSNTVVSNTMANSSRGASLDVDSWGNLLHHNNFLTNTVQAEDYGINQWDDGQQGNYWSDYSGTDADGDGVGDTPYAIPPNGVDRYPLMALYEGAHLYLPIIFKSVGP
jgi:parallel beta-helix repeat protein